MVRTGRAVAPGYPALSFHTETILKNSFSSEDKKACLKAS
jgi:hypothetical protein